MLQVWGVKYDVKITLGLWPGFRYSLPPSGWLYICFPFSRVLHEFTISSS